MHREPRVNAQGKTDPRGPEGATVVITHRVREGHQEAYERWLTEIAPATRASPGYIDWNVIRPVARLTDTYTFIIRFDTAAHLRQWMESDVRAALIDRVKPLLVTGDDFFIRTGLDFWFTPEGAKATVPPRWKQFIATWTALVPLVVAAPFAVRPALRWLGVDDAPTVWMLVETAVVVLLMTYLVMPRYTSLLKRWLFR